MVYTQVTLFHLLLLVAFAFGLVFGSKVGHELFGLIGGLAGGAVGAYVASLPVLWLWRVMHKAFFTELMSASNEELRSKLASPVWNFQQSFALLVLSGRGENVADALPRLRDMLRSEDRLVRVYGWDGVRLVFPALAEKLAGYDPKDLTEVCRSYVDRLEDVEWTLACAKPNAISANCPEGATDDSPGQRPGCST